ncbi:MAG: hypothetical protein QOH96_1789 [Blastocatellia bacterium]|nr:hypothetical protein [Blastocatellia bacterium]
MFEKRRENSPIIKLRQVNSLFISIAHSKDSRPVGPQASCLLNVGIHPTPTSDTQPQPTTPIQNRLRSRRTDRHLNRVQIICFAFESPRRQSVDR